MTNIDSKTARTIATEIDEAVKTILTKHGLAPSAPKVVYGDRFEYKITASANIPNEAGINTASPEAQAFLHNAKSHGLMNPERCMTEPFTYGGEQYIVIGYKTRARKRPFMIKSMQSGKTFVAPDDAARFMHEYDVDNDIQSDYAYKVKYPADYAYKTTYPTN